MRFQKYLILAALIVAALSFVYALSFCGGTIYQYGTLYDDDALIPGVKALFDASQMYNDVLVWLTIVFILVIVLNYIMSTHKRRNYYATNYVSIILTIVYAVGFAAVLAWIVTDTYTLFTAIDRDLAAANYLGTEGFSYSIINFIFGYIVVGIAVITAGLFIFNLVWKVKLMKGEKKLLAKQPVRIAEVAEEAV